MTNFYKKLFFLILYKGFFWKLKKQRGLIVLTYHKVTKDFDLNDPLKVALPSFEKQVSFLKKNYSIISGEQFADIIKWKKPFPESSCMITFDDGWKDNYTNAFPIIKKYGVPAVIFISTDYIGTNSVFWYEESKEILKKIPPNLDINNCRDVLSLCPEGVALKLMKVLKVPINRRDPIIHDLVITLKSFPVQKIRNLNRELINFFGIDISASDAKMLSWEQVKEMSQDNIYFGSHTKSHAILTQVSRSKAIEEIRESKENIESKTNQAVYSISYPNGNYNKLITSIAKEAGYLAGFTCMPGINMSIERPLELKRKHIREDSSMGLNDKFSELFFRVELSCIRDYLGTLRKAYRY